MNPKIQKRARDILDTLTLKEKIGQLVEYNFAGTDDIEKLSKQIKEYLSLT